MNSSPLMPRGNPKDQKPFVWINSFILRHLRELGDVTDGKSCVRTLISVYTAMAELATDHRSSTFTVSEGEIGKRAGISAKAASNAVEILTRAEMILVTPNYIHSGSLRVCNSYSLLQHDPKTCQFCRASGKTGILSDLPIPGESLEEYKREKSVPPPLLEMAIWVDELMREFPDRDDISYIAGKFRKFYSKNPNRATYERLVDWILQEKNPKYKTPQPPIEPEPIGWREYLAKESPKSDHSGRPDYERHGWENLQPEIRRFLISKLTSAA